MFPKDAVLLFYRGVLHERLASPLLQAGSKSLDDDNRGVSAIGTTQAELTRAERYYRDALVNDPDHADARLRHGRVLGELGHHKEAIADLRRVVDDGASGARSVSRASLSVEGLRSAWRVRSRAHVARTGGGAVPERADAAPRAQQYRQAHGQPCGRAAGASDSREAARCGTAAGGSLVGLLRSALTLAGALALAVALPSAQTFSSRIEAVRVDVLVTANGQPVQGLVPGDFEVMDNGVRQTVDLASFEQIPLNVVLALDMSASLQGLRLGHLQAAGSTVLDGLKPGDRAALVAFSHIVSANQSLTEDLDRVRALLVQNRGEGLTSLIDAAHTGMLIGESDVGRSLLIVFSDGVDTSSWLDAESVLETARRGDVVVYGVEVGARRASFSARSH